VVEFGIGGRAEICTTPVSWAPSRGDVMVACRSCATGAAEAGMKAIRLVKSNKMDTSVRAGAFKLLVLVTLCGKCNTVPEFLPEACH